VSVKEYQECGCSKREDKPGVKDHHSTNGALIYKVVVPQYLKRPRQGEVQRSLWEFSHEEKEMVKMGLKTKQSTM